MAYMECLGFASLVYALLPFAYMFSAHWPADVAARRLRRACIRACLFVFYFDL